MENEDIEKVYFKNRMSDIKEILQLHSEGKTSQEISTKTRTAESYVVYVLKSGLEGMSKEIAEQYGINAEDIPKEKSSLKKEDKVDKPHPSTNQELLCMDCTQILQQIESVVFNDFTFRMYKCPKCGKAYPHPLDSQGYLVKS